MRRILKWVGLGLAALLILTLVFILYTFVNTTVRMNRVYDFPAQAVSIPNDPASVANGRRIYLSHCSGCHLPDLGGRVIFEDPAIGRMVASNLTRGQGSAVGGNTDEEWVLAIRHGIDTDRKTLLVMPSQYYYHFTDQDLGDLIAFLKSAPPVDRNLGGSSTTFMGTLMSGLGLFGKIFPAEHIPHQAPRPAPVAEAVSAEYGEYVISHTGCADCHGEDLRGGRSPDPSALPAPNITQSGRLAAYDDAAFLTVMRSGLTPDKRALDAGQMPWPEFQLLTDTELQAAYLYLASLK